MLDSIIKINRMMIKKERIFLPFAAFMVLVFSLLETFSVGIILPYIKVITSPSRMGQIPGIGYIEAMLGITNDNDMILALSLGLVLVYLIKTLYQVVFTYVLLRYSRNIYDRIVKNNFSNLIKMPYIRFAKGNTADYSKSLLQELNNTVGAIPFFLRMIAEGLTILFLFSMMLIADWKLTLIIVAVFGIMLAVVFLTVSSWLKKLGVVKTKLLGGIYRALNESFGNIKILKSGGKESYAINQFMGAAKPYNEIQVTFGTLQVVPKSVVEFLGFLVVIFIVVYSVIQGNIASVLPKLMLFAVAFYRVLPSVNQIIVAYNNIAFNSASIGIVADYYFTASGNEGDAECTFQKDIVFKDVSFSYDKSVKILDNVNLTVLKGDKIGVMGESGSGKSTLIDLITGLLRHNTGELLVDGSPLTSDNVKNWKSKIGYIPQFVYLFDGTVAENVCMGSGYDGNRVERVLKQARIYDFLEKNKGLNTRVGEGGVMLSGGQRQRIAIARALYNDPELLVLDEATSSLDAETEDRIIDEIFDIAGNKTIIIVAHRRNTLKKCQAIYEVKDHKIGRIL